MASAHAFYDHSPLQDAAEQVDGFARNVVLLVFPDGAQCTGLLVGSSRILTAAHCLFDETHITEPMSLMPGLIHHGLKIVRYRPASPEKPYVVPIEHYSVAAPEDFKESKEREAGDMALIRLDRKLPNTLSDKLINHRETWLADSLRNCKSKRGCLVYALSARHGLFNFVASNRFDRIELSPRRSFGLLAIHDKDFIGEPGDSGSAVILCEDVYGADGCHLVGIYASRQRSGPDEGRVSLTNWYETLRERAHPGYLVFCADNSGGTSCTKSRP